MMNVERIVGVDFSGAKLAGRNIWLAEVDIVDGGELKLTAAGADRAATGSNRAAASDGRKAASEGRATMGEGRTTMGANRATESDGRTLPARAAAPRLHLRTLQSLESLAGSAERGPALAHLVDRITQSQGTLWAIDFPFALPIELACMGKTFAEQLAVTHGYAGDAYEFGRWLLAEAKKLGGVNHIRRQTDSEAKTPFDCYHYRIICQTFHGMRDVLRAIATDEQTAVLPFQYDRLPSAKRVVIEACPSTTLKRLGWPHQNYKQPTGGPLTAKRLAVRKVLYAGLKAQIEIPPALQRIMARNPGGDAIDAVLAAVGAWRSWTAADHSAIAKHARYPAEGFVYG